jgi:hypothetical protein
VTRDLLTRLADAGEEALAKLADGPSAERVVAPVRALRDRVDELQRRVRGIDALERRVTELERRLGMAGDTPDEPAPLGTKASGPGI